MCAVNRTIYFDHGEYAVIYLQPLRRWFEYVSSRKTQSEIADAAGLHRSTIWRFKSGKRIAPQSAYFLALGMRQLLADHPELRFGLDKRFGPLMEVQNPLF